jgi:N-acetylglutamate synthase-like GNAT family acetyltransferase
VRLTTFSVLELEYLAVHPDHTRKGIGSMLVQSGIDVATDLGLDVVVFAMGQGTRDLLVKAGFEVLEHESQDLSPYGGTGVYETFYLIKRAPKKEDS